MDAEHLAGMTDDNQIHPDALKHIQPFQPSVRIDGIYLIFPFHFLSFSPQADPSFLFSHF